MKLAFSGVQSVGKTTLITRLIEDAYFSNNYIVRKERIRELDKLGVPINEEGNNITQLLIMNIHLWNSLYDNSVLDRCVLDCMAYTSYALKHNKIDDWVFLYAQKIFELLIKKYDVIFYLIPEIDLEYDGVRSSSDEFRKEMIDCFNVWLKYIDVLNQKLEKKINIVRLSGTVEERYRKVKEIVLSLEK